MTEWLQRLRGAWDNLSLRERMLLSVSGGLLLLLLVIVLVVNPLFGAADRARTRADAAESQIAAMQRLQREYQQVATQLENVEKRILQDRDRTSLLTLLESLADRSSVKIESMEERQSPPSDRYRESRVDVSLKNVTLTQVVNYLHGIESSGRLMSVKSLRMRTRLDDPELLDVSFSVSTFEPV